MYKRVLVTGAAGFVGYHLCQQLAHEGMAVMGYDNFNPYYDPQLKRDRAENLRQVGVSILEGDICDLRFLKSSLEGFRPTHVVHLAAQAGVRYSLQDPHAYLASNIVGFLNILELCRLHPHVRLVYASSSSVYGLNTKVPFSETDRTDEQASLYGVTKKSNELMARTYHHLYGVQAIGLRFFTVYGPWGRPDMAYYSFTQDMLAGKPIRLFNYGKMLRDFTYIDDIVHGIVQAMEQKEVCEVFNLGNNHPEPLSHLIESLEDALGIAAEKTFLPMQSGDVEATYADIEKSHSTLSFQPKVSLREGIGRFVDWYLSYHNVRAPGHSLVTK